MEKELEKGLWEELKLLQPIINKFDDFFFQLKKWFIGTIAAVAGIGINQEEPRFLIINLFLVLAFYYVEAAYRAAHDAFLQRNRQIQSALRGEISLLGQTEMPPHLDRFLVHGEKELADLWGHMKRMPGK